jgi:hypothetical protein
MRQKQKARTSKPLPSDQLPTASSMRHVEALTGMPLTLIRAMKEAGCAAFDMSNRVRLSILLKFFFQQYFDAADEKPPDGLATWREALNRVQTHRQEILLAKDKGTVLDLPEAERRAAEAEAYYGSELDRLMREMPPALCGLSARQIHGVLEKFIDELRLRSQKKFSQYARP